MAIPFVNGAGGSDEEAWVPEDRPLRADARRNRARVLEVAFEVFANEGLAVPVHEIARRAGVGTGTVSRHFPTKESLYEAVLLSRAERLVAYGRSLAESEEPGPAFDDYFTELVREGTANLGVAEALIGAGYNMESLREDVADERHDVHGMLRRLLTAAQRAGAIRSDVDAETVKALMGGCLTAAPAARDQACSVVLAGLRVSPVPPA
jgi:AcrR family transcriptional regulator